jgi:hypothetical protein
MSRRERAARRLFRSRFTDTEWAIYISGRCCWQISYGTPHMSWCEQPSQPGHPFGYCAGHARELAEQTMAGG